MIKLAIRKDMLELAGRSDDATLLELLEASEQFVSALKGQSVQCERCGFCCHRPPVLGLDVLTLSKREGLGTDEWSKAHLMPPQFPDLAAREKGVAELQAQTGLARTAAAVLYEYNQSEPVTFRHDERDHCYYQNDNLCSNYADRPFVCRLYLCRFGPKLQDLLEMVVTQGTWHAYAVLGGVLVGAIAHNPFIGKDSYDDVLLKDFDFGLEGAAEALFSFF